MFFSQVKKTAEPSPEKKPGFPKMGQKTVPPAKSTRIPVPLPPKIHRQNPGQKTAILGPFQPRKRPAPLFQRNDQVFNPRFFFWSPPPLPPLWGKPLEDSRARATPPLDSPWGGGPALGQAKRRSPNRKNFSTKKAGFPLPRPAPAKKTGKDLQKKPISKKKAISLGLEEQESPPKKQNPEMVGSHPGKKENLEFRKRPIETPRPGSEFFFFKEKKRLAGSLKSSPSPDLGKRKIPPWPVSKAPGGPKAPGNQKRKPERHVPIACQFQVFFPPSEINESQKAGKGGEVSPPNAHGLLWGWVNLQRKFVNT